METNQAGITLIAEFEGFVGRWYLDPVGIWTCCYGHTDSAGAPLYKNTKGKTFTRTEGMEILKRDLLKYEAAVLAAVHVPLNENQFSALVSFTYNLGPGNLRSSTLLRKLNAGDYAGASAEFGKWVKAGGKTLNGLVRRRAAERALFDRPASSSRPPARPVTSNPLAALFALLARIFGGKK